MMASITVREIREKWDMGETVVPINDDYLREVMLRAAKDIDLIRAVKSERDWKKQDELAKALEDRIGVPVVFGEAYFWPALVIHIDDSDMVATLEITPERFIRIQRWKKGALMVDNRANISIGEAIRRLSDHDIVLVEVYEDEYDRIYRERYLYRGIEIEVRYPFKSRDSVPDFDLIKKVVENRHLIFDAMGGCHQLEALDALEEKLGMKVYRESRIEGGEALAVPSLLIYDWTYRYYKSYSRDTLYVHGMTIADIVTPDMEIDIDIPSEYHCTEDPDYSGCCTEVCLDVVVFDDEEE